MIRNHALILCAFALACVAASLVPTRDAGAMQLESPAAELGKIRSLAESQHEIVMILIRKRDFAQALQEAGKIFEMKWPPDQEPLLIRELRYLSEQFVGNGQPASAIQMLEGNLRHFRAASSRAAVWKEKGYVYKKMGQDDRAMECFREAQRIEKGQ